MALEELVRERDYRDLTRSVVLQLETEGGTFDSFCVLQAPDGRAVVCHTPQEILHILEIARTNNEREATRAASEPKNRVLWEFIRNVIPDLWEEDTR